MGFRYRLGAGDALEADTLPEFIALLVAMYGIKPLGVNEQTTLACEQCGHLTTATTRVKP